MSDCMINEDLIREYAEGATDEGINRLISLYDHLVGSERRASEISRAYLRRITELEVKLGQKPTIKAIEELEPKATQLGRDLRRARKQEENPPATFVDIEDMAGV